MNILSKIKEIGEFLIIGLLLLISAIASIIIYWFIYILIILEKKDKNKFDNLN